LDGDNVSFNLKQEFNENWVSTDSHIIFSANEFTGSSPSSYNIQEAIACSDGSNAWGQVDLGGTDGWATLSTSLTLNKNTGLTKDSTKTGTKFELQYARLPDANEFKDDAEQIQTAYIGASNWVGTQIALVNTGTGDFDIRTGTDGVSIIVNNATNVPVIRTGGALKVYAGI